MPPSPADPKLWQLLSFVALAVAVLGLILGESFGWAAFLASGIFFAIEQLLLLRARRAAPR